MVEVFEGDNEIKSFRLILPPLGLCGRALVSGSGVLNTGLTLITTPGATLVTIYYTALDTFYTSLAPVSVCLIILEIETLFDGV